MDMCRELAQMTQVRSNLGGPWLVHSGKKKLNEPRECLFKGLQSKVLVEK